MPLSMDDITNTYERYRRSFDDRDQRMNQVLQVRQGKMRDVYPDLFPDGPFENPIVANMVDIAARDIAEVIAPLPSFSCTSTVSCTHADMTCWTQAQCSRRACSSLFSATAFRSLNLRRRTAKSHRLRALYSRNIEKRVSFLAIVYCIMVMFRSGIGSNSVRPFLLCST